MSEKQTENATLTENETTLTGTETTLAGNEDATRTYYESTDVDRFYDIVWGGEDIHTATAAEVPMACQSSRSYQCGSVRVAWRRGFLPGSGANLERQSSKKV